MNNLKEVYAGRPNHIVILLTGVLVGWFVVFVIVKIVSEIIKHI